MTSRPILHRKRGLLMQRVQLVDHYADRFTKICLGEDVPKLRPTYGDKIDLGSTRLELALLMAYSPEVRLWVYDISKNVGKALATKLRERGILHEFLKATFETRWENSLAKNFQMEHFACALAATYSLRAFRM